MNTKQRADKTLAYLGSERGLANWKANAERWKGYKGRGSVFEFNLFAAVQTATRLIKYERVWEVIDEIKRRWSQGRRAA